MSQAWWLRFQFGLTSSDQQLDLRTREQLCQQVEQLIKDLLFYQASAFKDVTTIRQRIVAVCQLLFCGPVGLHDCSNVGPNFQQWLEANMIEVQSWLEQWLRNACGLVTVPIKIPCQPLPPAPPGPLPPAPPGPTPGPTPPAPLPPAPIPGPLPPAPSPIPGPRPAPMPTPAPSPMPSPVPIPIVPVPVTPTSHKGLIIGSIITLVLFVMLVIGLFAYLGKRQRS